VRANVTVGHIMSSGRANVTVGPVMSSGRANVAVGPIMASGPRYSKEHCFISRFL
jgi:hypothetical protein